MTPQLESAASDLASLVDNPNGPRQHIVLRQHDVVDQFQKDFKQSCVGMGKLSRFTSHL